MIFTKEQIDDAIRELEEHKNRLIKLRQLREQVEALEAQIVPGTSDIKFGILQIRDAVCAHFNLSKLEIMSKGRADYIAMPRQVCFFLARKILDAGPSEIGRMFGKDHGTIIHGQTVIAERISIDSDLKRAVEQIEAAVKLQLKSVEEAA